MDKCCVDAAESKFREEFPQGPGIGGGDLYRYLLELTKQWGPITELYAQAFTIRSVDEVALDTAAKILQIECANRHATYLIVVNERLYYFIWRINLIVASHWKIDGHDLVPEDSHQSWPTDDQLEQLDIAFQVYLGKQPLSDIGLTEFNALVFRSEKVAQLIYKFTVDLAELFVFLHECGHAVPAPGVKAQIELPAELNFVSPKRRERWLTEMRTDASATYVLFLAAGKYFAEHFGLSSHEATKVAAGFVFAGIDAALHTLLVLETLRFGEVSPERWGTDPVWAKHPPIVLRRNSFGEWSKALAQMVLDATEWEEVRYSVGSMAHVRQQMFDKYLQTHGDRL